MKEAVNLSREEIDKRLAEILEEHKKRRKADILFCLDCTGSMKGEMEAVKDTVAELSETMGKDGMHVRLGLIEFRDRLFGEEHKVHNFGGQVFTNDPAAFRCKVSGLKAGGGHDEPESSLDAIMLACSQPFDTGSTKVIVLITDAPPHIPDKEAKSIEEVIERIKETGIDHFYCAIRAEDPQSNIYRECIVKYGMVFNLGRGDDFKARRESFKRILKSLGMTITRGSY